MYASETCETREGSPISIRDVTEILDYQGTDGSCFSVDSHLLCARTHQEKQLWLGVLSHVKTLISKASEMSSHNLRSFTKELRFQESVTTLTSIKQERISLKQEVIGSVPPAEPSVTLDDDEPLPGISRGTYRLVDASQIVSLDVDAPALEPLRAKAEDVPWTPSAINAVYDAENWFHSAEVDGVADERTPMHVLEPLERENASPSPWSSSDECEDTCFDL
jgi:hypothetical protein